MCDSHLQTPCQTPNSNDLKGNHPSEGTTMISNEINSTKSNSSAPSKEVDSKSQARPTVPARLQTIKGTCAQFLRQNPRFINEPICHVLPNETSHSVGDCLQWKEREGVGTGSMKKSPQSKVNHSLDSTSRSDYQPHPADKLPAPLCKHPPVQRTSGIAPLVNEPPETKSKVKELISFRHNYNSRNDPNEPVRGKLHGSFVWDPLKPPQQYAMKTLLQDKDSHSTDLFTKTN